MKKEVDQCNRLFLRRVVHSTRRQWSPLSQNDGFNILWDCVTFLDDATLSQIKRLGGVNAIALSHPHFYSTQVEWVDAFDAPIYISRG